MFDRKDPNFVYPPAHLRLLEYVRNDDKKLPVHRWWPVFGDGDWTHYCKDCGLKIWTKWDSVVLSRRTEKGGMPTCEESAPEQVMAS